MLNPNDEKLNEKDASEEIDILKVPASKIFAYQHAHAIENINKRFERIVRKSKFLNLSLRR